MYIQIQIINIISKPFGGFKEVTLLNGDFYSFYFKQ